MTRKFSAVEISNKIEALLIGNGEAIISGIKGIEDVSEGELTFADNSRHLAEALLSKCAGVICPAHIAPKEAETKLVFIVKNPKLAFARALELFDEEPQKNTGINKSAHISETAKVGKNAYIGANTVIDNNAIIGENAVIYPNVYIGENVIIGDNVKLHPGVVIYYNCVVGNNVTIHANAVIGSDGFGYALCPSGHYKVPQIGNVVIHDNAEIGAHASIDRATTMSTIIGTGVKIDNHVHLAHNVQIGDNSLIISNVGIAGSSKVGKNCIIAGQTGVRDHITIGDNTVVIGMSGVTKNIKPNSVVSGFPAKPHTEEKKLKASYIRMPETIKTVQSLQQAILRLQRRLEALESKR